MICRCSNDTARYSKYSPQLVILDGADMPIPIEQHIRLAELRKKLEGKLKITDSGPDSLGIELLPGNDDALPEFHQLLDLLKEIMQSKTSPPK
jgi:hypothetical protein